MKILDDIHRPGHGPVVQFVLRVHPLVWYGGGALVGLIIGLLK
jgi:hypothetical protein